MITFRSFLLGLVALVCSQAHALSVEYRFAGELTAQIGTFSVEQRFEDTPFSLSIFADTDDMAPTGYIAGAGRGYSNKGTKAIWNVAGLGSATSFDAQIYTLPGLGRVGFGWDGQVFPLNSGNLAQTHIYFTGTEIAMDSSYSRLSAAVAPIAIKLQSSLKNPPSAMPQYTTSVFFDGVGPLTLKSLSNVSYSVVEVPEPSTFALLIAGLGVVGALVKRRSVAAE